MAEKAALENPDQIGCFRIVKKIGEGSFGKVFLGKNSATESYAAIKSAKRSRDARIMAINNRMIRAEASILGQLTHKNIVKLYQSIEEEGIHSMVIEFVSGIDLGKLLASEKTVFTEREASSIIKNILEGLEYLHSKNITHRDIKPMPLSRDYSKLKLTDFGLSVFMSTLDRKELEMKCGTPMYISPERLGKQKYSTNADLFSVGIIMHELLSPNSCSRLQLKWQKPTQTTLLNYDLAARSSEISDPIAQHLFEKLTEQDPLKRYTAKEALQHPWVTGSESIALQFSSRHINHMKALSDQFRHCMKAALVVAFMKHCVSATDFKSSSKSQIAACGHDCDSIRVMKKALYATQSRTVRKQSTKINLQSPERVILIRSRAYSKKIDNEEIIDILPSSCQLRPRSSANMLDSDSTLDTPGKGTKAFCQMPQAKADLALLKTTNVLCQDQFPVPLDSSNDLAKRELYKKDHVKEYTPKMRESSTNKELNDRKKILAILFPAVNKPLKSISKQSFLVPTSKPEAPSTRKTLCHPANRRLAEVGRSLPSLTRVHH